ncbi:hypothetical protein J6590_076295 [Homalodisca vitripennis]|nr:hypothetical protein J6590_076295 [Homalodisca vitripennis]
MSVSGTLGSTTSVAGSVMPGRQLMRLVVVVNSWYRRDSQKSVSWKRLSGLNEIQTTTTPLFRKYDMSTRLINGICTAKAIAFHYNQCGCNTMGSLLLCRRKISEYPGLITPMQKIAGLSAKASCLDGASAQ